jgi:hypothetical protein
MADDAVDVVRGDDGFRGIDDVLKQCAPADLVQDLGTAGLETSAFAGAMITTPKEVLSIRG